MKQKILVLAIFLLTSLTIGQVKLDKKQFKAVKEFTAKYSKNAKISWNNENGSPDIITFSKPEITDRSTDKATSKFLSEIKEILKSRSGKDTLLVVKQNEHRGVKSIHLQQKYKGIPVFGGNYVLTLTKDGKIKTALGSFYKDIELNVEPIISLNNAISIAKSNVQKGVELSEKIYSSELIIYPKDKKFYLVHKIHIYTTDGLFTWKYIIDAENGKLIEKSSDAINSSQPSSQGQGRAYMIHPNHSNYVAVTLPNLFNNGFLRGTYVSVYKRIQNENHAYNITNNFIYSPGSWNQYSHFDEVNLYYHVNKFRENFWNNLSGSSSINNKFISISAYTRANVANASYSRSNHAIYFSGFHRYAVDANVIYHEYTHAITHKIANLYYSNENFTQSGAISEGNSDYFAASFSGYPQIGEYSFTDERDKRDLQNPRFASIDSYLNDRNLYDPYRYQNNHDAGSLWSATLWDLRNALGATVTDQLVFDALFHIPTNCSFLQYRQAILDACAGNAYYFNTTYAIFKNRGIWSPPSVMIDGPTNISSVGFGLYYYLVFGDCFNYSLQWIKQVEGESVEYLGSNDYLLLYGRNDGKSFTLEVAGNETTFNVYLWDMITVTNNSGPGFDNVQNPEEEMITFEKTEILPEKYSLDQNYPNPFNPSTTIKYQLKESGWVSLKVYDIQGREIAVLVNEEKPAGSYSNVFNASNLSSGIYIYKLITKDYTESKKMLLVK